MIDDEDRANERWAPEPNPVAAILTAIAIVGCFAVLTAIAILGFLGIECH